MLDDLENKLSFMFTHLFHLLSHVHFINMKINKFSSHVSARSLLSINCIINASVEIFLTLSH